ncbi:MAG: glycerate kinase [Pseudomonadota bacterium]
MPPPYETLLIEAFHSAVRAVSAESILPPHLPARPRGRLLVAAIGKAAADMAACVERHWPADAPLDGLAITRHGHGVPTHRTHVVEAGHPLPDRDGQEAARAMLELIGRAAPDDHVLALISGGGSSLLTLPAPGLTLPDIQATVRGLLGSGAPIADINCVRKHLSLTLGGRLAAACRAPVTALLLSDVVGDDPGVIASGPFHADVTTHADALAVLDAWHVEAPAAVVDFLCRGTQGEIQETPKPGAACFERVDTRIIGSGTTALAGAAAFLEAQGVEVVQMGDRHVGEAEAMARYFAAEVRGLRACAPRRAKPLALLSGGEAQVTVRGGGRGGRNGQFLLALALDTRGLEGIHALAADTDGIDGTGDNAGAILTPTTLERAAALGLDAPACLARNDAYGFFAALDDLLVTGPTRTNANDFRAILLA